jgi:hypothetical protein
VPRRIDVRERVPADEPEVGRFLAERRAARRRHCPRDAEARDPALGEHGIPLRDELILEKEVVT